MLSEKITIVYATSPHRFGSSIAMLELSICTLKEFGFKDCDIVICTDGINKNSRYDEDSQRKQYADYLKKLKINFESENVKILNSRENIGLTLNYKQAWDQDAIKTDYVFFMNHDAAVNPGFYLLDLEKIIDEFPEDAKTLIFARDDEDYWKKWFNPKEHEINKGEWKNTLKCFAFQDNACIMKKETFLFYIEEFYNPEVTKFLEDSLQQRLRHIGEIQDENAWKEFGTYVWKDPLTFHLDGQSKANNHNFSEKVWSKGFCYSKNLKKLKEHSEERSELWVAVECFIHQERDIQAKKIMDNFIEFSSRLLNFTKLHFDTTQDAFLEPGSAHVADPPKTPPQQSKKLKETVHITENSVKFYWKQGANENVIAKICCDGKQILYGGNQQGMAEVFFSDLPNKNTTLQIKLEKFGEDGFFKNLLLDEYIDLSIFTISPDFVHFCWINSPPSNLNLYISEKDKRKPIGSAKRAWVKGSQQFLLSFAESGLLYGQTIKGSFANKSNGYKSWDFHIDVPCGYEYDYSINQKTELIIKNVHKNLVSILPEYSNQDIETILRKLK